MSNFFQNRNRHPLRYYIYISQTKVEMLLPQVPAKRLRSLEADIKVNAGVVAAGVKTTPATPAPELAAKAQVISDFLDKQPGLVGTLTNPASFVRGAASLRYGCVGGEYAPLAVFGGAVDGGMKLALIGSTRSLVGAPTDLGDDHSLNAYVRFFLLEEVSGDPQVATKSSIGPAARYLGIRIHRPDIDDDDKSSLVELEAQVYQAATDRVLAPGVLPPVSHQMEFLARVLFHDDHVLAATPIYVALAN